MTLHGVDYFMMGTLIHIEVGGERLSSDIFEKVGKRLRELEGKFTVNRSESQVMAINQQAGLSPVSADSEVFYVTQRGLAAALDFPSTFNPLIGPLVKSWHIGFKDAKVPSQKEIQEKLTLISLEDVLLDREKLTVYLRKKGMALDLGAIAKGYIADEIKKLVLKEGAICGIINLGGNVLVFGDSPKQADGYWRVGIQNPFKTRGEIVGFFKIKNQSVVTSGIYERQLLLKGQTYHHILDGATGAPLATEIASLTIIHGESIEADLWSTLAYGKTLAASQRLLGEKLGMIVTQEKQIFISKALSASFRLLDDAFVLLG